MEASKGKGKKSLITKTWNRCKSLGSSRKTPSAAVISHPGLIIKSKSCPHISLEDEKRSTARKHRVAPEGCFSVYVGPEKQRFVIKTEYANHPLFRMLLEEAESEYGFNSDGPLELPCNVEIFYNVLMEMDGDDRDVRRHKGCGFAKGRYGSYRLLSPTADRVRV